MDKQEIISLLKSDGKELFKSADEVRRKHVGDEVHLRGLIEFSNICKRDCLYCGLRSSNKNAERYRLSKEEILDFAHNAIENGYKTIVLQSGEDEYFTTEILCDIIKEIKKHNVAVTLSIGERDDYAELKAAGADRFLLRIETTDEELYKKLHPNMSLKNRKQCLYDIKSAGFETGTGCLVGLPGQTIESLANDILFFKELGADMIGIGPFIAHKDTPLGGTQSDNFELALKVMAVTRLVLPYINIPATTAMGVNEGGRLKALQSGANVVMPNVTGEEYRKKYQPYPKKDLKDEYTRFNR